MVLGPSLDLGKFLNKMQRIAFLIECIINRRTYRHFLQISENSAPGLLPGLRQISEKMNYNLDFLDTQRNSGSILAPPWLKQISEQI